jgi:hypothetical protein
MMEEQHQSEDIWALKLTTWNKNITTDVQGRFWIRTESGRYPHNVLYAPASFRDQILQEGHSSKLARHDGSERMFRRITTSYWWPTLIEDIQGTINRCTICQKKDPKGIQQLPLMPLPVPEGRNQPIQVDLLGPLKSTGTNKYILGITDAFTKIGVLVAIPDKEANTVASAILH